jgi:hypothetical protein
MPLPRIKLIEIVALLPATLVLAPVIGASAIMLTVVVIVSVLDTSQSIHSRAIQIREEAALLSLLLSGMLGLAGTWVAVLTGADRLERKAWLRRALPLCCALGIIAACYWLFWTATSKHQSAKWGSLFWGSLLAPAIAVGARELRLLMTGNRPPNRPDQPSRHLPD